MATEVMATEATGNTKSRGYQLTLNDVTRYEELKDNLTSYKSLQYLISCEELAPTTGHKHIHIYVYFKNPIKLSVKKCCGAHIERCRGTPKQNIEYIIKDGNILDEIGDRPHQGIKSIKELMECTREEVPAQLIRIYDNEKDKMDKQKCFMDMLDEIDKDNLQGPKVIYISGPSGKGKTYTAYKKALSMYPKENIGKITLNNGFADIVNDNAKCFIIEEFRPSDIKGSKLLEMIDKYGASINTKGGFKYLRPECYIIASIVNPYDLYTNEEHNKQFIRRITEHINLGKESTNEMASKYLIDE